MLYFKRSPPQWLSAMTDTQQWHPPHPSLRAGLLAAVLAFLSVLGARWSRDIMRFFF